MHSHRRKQAELVPCLQSPRRVTSEQMAGLCVTCGRFQTHGQTPGRAQGAGLLAVLCPGAVCAVGWLALLVTC